MIEQTDNKTSKDKKLEMPLTSDGDSWKAYWLSVGQRWRTEPEIDQDRQNFLVCLLTTIPDDEPNMSPFLGVELTRADVEWLDANPLVDVKKLVEQLEELSKDKDKVKALDIPELRRKIHSLLANENRLDLRSADLRRVDFTGIRLEGVSLQGAMLEASNLRGAVLPKGNLSTAFLAGAHLEHAQLYDAHLEGAHLEGANLRGAFFDDETKLDRAFLNNTKYGPIILDGLHWNEADLSLVDWTQIKILGDEKSARNGEVSGKVKLKEYSEQEEYKQEKYKDTLKRLRKMYKEATIEGYKHAVRANRRLGIVLQGQGLIEEARTFTYRSQVLQRLVLRKQKKFGAYLASLFLDLLSGYGYKPERSFLAYIFVISLFTFTYHLLGSQLRWNEALIISMTAFHGRGFSLAHFH